MSPQSPLVVMSPHSPEIIRLRVDKYNKYFFLPTARKGLSTFRKYWPSGVQTAQTVVHYFVHFQGQARMAVRSRSVYHHLSRGPHCRLKVATQCCVVVHLCLIRIRCSLDQPDTIAVTWSECPCWSCTLSNFYIPPPFTEASSLAQESRSQPCA